MEQVYDVAVIGGGPAGYVAAIKASQLGGKVLLFEKDVVGGTCLNRGCIPTKSFLKTAEMIHHIQKAGERGVCVADPTISVDMKRVVEEKNAAVKKLTGGVAGLLRAYKVEVVHAAASLMDATRVEAEGKVYSAKAVILCGGSQAGRIPVPGADLPGVVTSDELLDMDHVPGRLAIVGGGVIGCEMATAFSAFGSRVTIVEALPGLVATMDAEVGNALERSFTGEGIQVVTGAALENIQEKDGGLVLSVAGRQPIQADTVLLSVGRRAQLECLGRMKDAVATQGNKILTDEFMRTNIPGVYAAGDLVAGQAMLAHAAFKMGEVAAENAMGHSNKANLSVVPGCVYTIPEAASVGLSDAEARERYGDDVLVGRFNLGANGRAIASGETGFVKVVAGKQYGQLLGVHMVGGAATEMIAQPAALMDMQVTVHEIANIIHPHPTYSEAFMEACADALGRCIHLPPKA